MLARARVVHKHTDKHKIVLILNLVGSFYIVNLFTGMTGLVSVVI